MNKCTIHRSASRQENCGDLHLKPDPHPETCRLQTLQTFSNVLQLYGVHTSKELVLPAAATGGAAGAPPLHRMHVFLQHSLALPGGALCNDITGDSRSVLLGMVDGSLQVYSWAAQVCSSEQYE